MTGAQRLHVHIGTLCMVAALLCDVSEKQKASGTPFQVLLCTLAFLVLALQLAPAALLRPRVLWASREASRPGPVVWYAGSPHMTLGPVHILPADLGGLPLPCPLLQNPSVNCGRALHECLCITAPCVRFLAYDPAFNTMHQGWR